MFTATKLTFEVFPIC